MNFGTKLMNYMQKLTDHFGINIWLGAVSKFGVKLLHSEPEIDFFLIIPHNLNRESHIMNVSHLKFLFFEILRQFCYVTGDHLDVFVSGWF